MPLPGNVSLVTVTATYKFIDDSIPTGTVSFRPSGDPWLKDASADTILLPKSVECSIDAQGRIVGPGTAVGVGGHGVVLPATDDSDLIPNGFVYDVSVNIGGLPVQEYSISLPAASATVDLADLAPVTPVEGSGVPVVTTVNGISPNSSGALTLPGSAISGVRLIKAPVTLADGATIATDASLADLYRVTLAGNRTLANPTSPTDGQLVRWEITQDGTGSRTLALDTKFVYGADLPSITLSTTAGKTDILGAVYHQASDKWRVVAFAKGF